MSTPKSELKVCLITLRKFTLDLGEFAESASQL